MESKLVEKVNETSVQVVDKSRRNFLKYLVGGVVGTSVVSGLGYLGYENFRKNNLSLSERIEEEIEGTFRYPALDEKAVKKSDDIINRIIVERIDSNPKEAEEYLFSEIFSESDWERYKSHAPSFNDEKIFKRNGRNIDFSVLPVKFSDSDKLALFYFKNRDKFDESYPEMKVRILFKKIYSNPNNAKKYIFYDVKSFNERYEQFDPTKLSQKEISEDEEDWSELMNRKIDFPDNGNFSESDKLAIFFIENLRTAIAEAMKGIGIF